MTTGRVHGGTDARGVAEHDFSTNANACGPCPHALDAVRAADARHYPDPSYAALRAALARRHGVAAGRIALAASGSEFIFRVTALVARRGGRVVAVPRHAYGDYAAAAQAWGLRVVPEASRADLAWHCEPSNPLGQAAAPHAAATPEGALVIWDRAYEPLRLAGQPSPAAEGDWQLWTPNKALGLTGVRAAYAVAPEGAHDAVAALDALAPSWVLGAHGVALLQAWCDPATEPWLQACRPTLAAWKRRQAQLCGDLGWSVLPGEANFFVARTPLDAAALARLRAGGVQLRDATSFGLPGHARLAVLPPGAQDALRRAVEALA